jgi:hypothetical protein
LKIFGTYAMKMNLEAKSVEENESDTLQKRKKRCR